MRQQICQECNVVPATRQVFMDGDSFGNDILHLCDACHSIHFMLVEAKETFTIGFTDCEINGRREYLYGQNTLYRVRLFDHTPDGVRDAIQRFRNGLENGTLYKMVF